MISNQISAGALTVQTDHDGPLEARRPPTILIVDDEPDQLQLLSTYFRRAGCLVVAAIDAEHALNLLAHTQPELMVLDLRLPGIDGWELTARLRAVRPGCPIAITSVLDVDDYPPAEGVLPKPVTAGHVKALLRHTFPGRVR
jgi:CheY-like chemotaxis protein